MAADMFNFKPKQHMHFHHFLQAESTFVSRYHIRSTHVQQCYLSSYNKFCSSFYSVIEFLISIFIQFQFLN